MSAVRICGNLSGVEIGHDMFDARVFLKSVAREVFAMARVLETAMWHLSNHRDMGIDPDASEIEGLRHTHRTAMVLCPDT